MEARASAITHPFPRGCHGARGLSLAGAAACRCRRVIWLTGRWIMRPIYSCGTAPDFTGLPPLHAVLPSGRRTCISMTVRLAAATVTHPTNTCQIRWGRGQPLINNGITEANGAAGRGPERQAPELAHMFHVKHRATGGAPGAGEGSRVERSYGIRAGVVR
jgi:hypothetical protein